MAIQHKDCIFIKRKERLITATSNSISNIRPDGKQKKTKNQKWEEKQLYGYFQRQIDGIAHDKTWT